MQPGSVLEAALVPHVEQLQQQGREGALGLVTDPHLGLVRVVRVSEMPLKGVIQTGLETLRLQIQVLVVVGVETHPAQVVEVVVKSSFEQMSQYPAR